MYLGSVIGTVVATRKDQNLKGVKLLIVQPLNHRQEAAGEPFVAVDTAQAGPDQLVFWVGAREAPKALPAGNAPVDAAIVGIVDRVDV